MYEYEPGHCPDSEDGLCMADIPCSYGCDSENKPTYDELRQSLRQSLLRTHWVLCHPSIGGTFVMAAIHGQTYTGPVWHKQSEIQEALRLAGLPEELPTPIYPKEEVGVYKKKYQDVQVGDQTITEHRWEAAPPPEEALFLGDFVECQQWMAEQGIQDKALYTGGLGRPPASEPCEYYATTTGRVLDRGEEKAFFAQFIE